MLYFESGKIDHGREGRCARLRKRVDCQAVLGLDFQGDRVIRKADDKGFVCGMRRAVTKHGTQLWELYAPCRKSFEEIRVERDGDGLGG